LKPGIANSLLTRNKYNQYIAITVHCTSEIEAIVYILFKYVENEIYALHYQAASSVVCNLYTVYRS